MNNWKHGIIAMLVMTATLILLTAGPAFAADRVPITPELAAKREMVRKQQEQRITPEKRKAAAEALKAERLKIHRARQVAKQLPPVIKNNK
jgi:hypothetical protein